MKYRFKKNQLFRKKLDMPEHVLNKIYNNTLTFQEYTEYNLEDKVPISCLTEVHRNVVERFGVERSKSLDWDLINLKGFELIGTLKDISETSDNINEELYRFVIADMRPRDYTDMMKKVYSNCVLDDPSVPENLRSDFNSGYLKINDLVMIWDQVKEKDLSLCLKNDYYNKEQITPEELKKFMEEYHGLLALVDEPNEIYNMIATAYRSSKPVDEKNAYFKTVVEKILDKTINSSSWKSITLNAEQYKVIFQYTSVKDYLYKKLGDDHADKIIEELDGRDPSYLLDLPIPFNVLIEKNVLSFIETYGLDNVVNFDDECGHFFTNNDCEMLRLMHDMYIHYGANEHDKDRTIFTKKPYDKDGNYIERPYTKEEFYEAIRRMIVYGPTDWNYTNRIADYRTITGEFRELNPELFVDEKAPEEFQKVFYTKSLSPIFIRDNFNCISYLIGKKLSTIFSPLSVKVSKTDDGFYYRFENVYKFLEEKLGFEETIKIITDYADVFDVLFSSYDKLSQTAYIAPLQFSGNDTNEDIINKINDKLYELIIKANIKYSSNLSKSMKEKYPNVFIGYKAPKDLHKMFYNREINANYIIEHPEHKKYFEGLDIELFFNYMPIILVNNYDQTTEEETIQKSNRKIENLISYVKTLFGNEEGLSTLLAYNIYLDKVNEKLGFSKVEFKDGITKEEFLSQVDCLIYLNIIKGEILYDENMPKHFKAAYPSLFLLEDTPEDIKYKFYNRLFTLEDFDNNPVLLKHFANTDIACCLDTTFSYMIGLFNSNDFLDIIKLCGESIKSDSKLFGYLRTKTDDLLSIRTMGQLLYDYFLENDESLRYLILLKKLGFENEHTISLSEQFNKLLKVRPELGLDNPSLCSKLLDNIVIQQYGYDVITSVLKYNSGAYKVIINAINNNDVLLQQWISYFKRLPIYNEKLLQLALLNYETSKTLIYSLVSDNVVLNEDELFNLEEILKNKNKYNIENIIDLANYDNYRNSIIEEKINSNSLNVVRDGLLEKLFNTSLKDANRLFKVYGLHYQDFVKSYLIEDNAISVEEEAIIEIIREIYTTDDAESLKKRFKEFDIDNIRPSLIDIEEKLRKYYGKILKNSLYKADFKDSEGIRYSTIIGVDASHMVDIKGNYMTSQTKIDVVNLEGIEFKLLVSKLPDSDNDFQCASGTIINNPDMWNKLELGNKLTTNMISNTYMGCIGHGDRNAIYYGFNDITDLSLKLMSRRDIIVENNGINLEPNSNINEFMLPDVLQAVSSSYNTLELDLNSSETVEYNHRLQPNCIVCFDGYISSESKRAAHYFNIPIYMIDRDKYNKQNKSMIDTYKKETISFFDISDMKKILYTHEITLKERYQLFLKLIDEALDKDIVKKDKYIKILQEGRKIMLAYSTQNDMSSINLDEISNRLDQLEEKAGKE